MCTICVYIYIMTNTFSSKLVLVNLNPRAKFFIENICTCAIYRDSGKSVPVLEHFISNSIVISPADALLCKLHVM